MSRRHTAGGVEERRKENRKSNWDWRDTFFHRRFLFFFLSFFLNNSFEKDEVYWFAVENSPFSLSISFRFVRFTRSEKRVVMKQNMKNEERKEIKMYKKKDNKTKFQAKVVPAFHSVRSNLVPRELTEMFPGPRLKKKKT